MTPWTDMTSVWTWKKTISSTWHNATEMPQHKRDCYELWLYCTRMHNAPLRWIKQKVFKIVPLWSLSFPSESRRLHLHSQTVSVWAANSNTEITYSVAHGTLSALVQAWKEGREGGIRFSSPEIGHTGGAILVRPPPAGCVMKAQDSWSPAADWNTEKGFFKLVFAEKIEYIHYVI